MQRKKKVLHVFKTYPPDTFGGIEKVIELLARGCDKHGWQSQIFCLTQDKSLVSTSLSDTVYRVKTSFEIASTPFSFGAFKVFWKLAQKADVLHFHYPYPFADILGLFIKKKPFVLTYHSDIVKQKWLKYIYLPFQAVFFSRVNEIVCTSLRYKNSSQTLRKYLDKTTVIHLGVEVAKKPTGAENIEKFDIKSPYALFLGTLRNYKGLEILLEAAKDIKTHIVIAGDGEMRQKLESVAKKNNLQNVQFVGRVSEDEKSCLLNSALCCVLPSNMRSEAFGMVLLEAAAHSVPLVTAEIGTGTSQINLDKVTGVVVKHSDPIALTEAINFLYENPVIAEKMGLQANLRFKNFFSATLMCFKYAQIYNKVLKEFDKN